MRKKFYNLSLNVINSKEALNIFDEYLLTERNHLVFFINAHCFNVSQQNSAYKNAILESDLVLNDGIGIKIASILFQIKLKENMNGTDLTPMLLELGHKRNSKIFLLGGKPGIAEIAAEKIINKYPGIQIVGHNDGYFTEEQEIEIIDDIRIMAI